ncbi:hypothetical protein TRVA0_035S01266 [Trichomonascus vanleenenianus]|uniref:uncharacterized protein n=1 Tax=Trichomonascus vanleenenianus TaxID=2268995 RepID=UPI003ECACF28
MIRTRITGLARTRVALPAARYALARQQRFYSSSPFKLSEEQRGDEKVKQRSVKWLLILGALALGSSILAKSQNTGGGRQPIQSLEDQVDNAERFKTAREKMSVIFVLGGPGAGKGTQCANLVRDYGFVHLSAGDLLRQEQNRPGSEVGQLIADYIKAGKIVPQEVTIGLLDREIKENLEQGRYRFLVDGFPRKMDQALTFEEKVAVSEFTLFFECPEQVMLERLLHRGKTSGRTDDNVESITKRFHTFIETSMPVVDYFDKQGKVVRLQCDKKPEEVYETVKAVLKERKVIN